MSGPHERTTLELLHDWRAGNRAALDALIERHLPWIRDYVHRRLSPMLRRKEETLEHVQEAVAEVLCYGPRFEIADEDCFRGLLARIVENNLRDRDKWYHRACRDRDRERSRFTDSVLALDPPVRSVTDPAQRVDDDEAEEWIRLGIELLDPADRELIVLREWQGLEFAEIGERIGVPANTARMRFQRALPRLAQKVAELRSGRLQRLLAEPGSTPGV